MVNKYFLKFTNYRVNGKGYNQYVDEDQKNAWGSVTFEVELPNKNKQLICTNFTSRKGGITSEEKCNQVKKFLQQMIDNGIGINIKEYIKQNQHNFKIYKSYEIDTQDPIYQEVYRLFNGNK